MPKPPARATNRDHAVTAVFRAVGLVAVVLLIHAVSDGWDTSYALLTAGIGIPLIAGASFVADRFIPPAVRRRTANRR